MEGRANKSPPPPHPQDAHPPPPPPCTRLEVLAHGYADALRQRKCLWVGDACEVEAACNGEVEGVEGGLVGDDAHVGGERVAREVHLWWGGEAQRGSAR
jgi:hypothetical protein